MKYTDIAWDFDGALYDSYPHINADLQYVLRQFGLEASLEEINAQTRITQGHAFAYFAPLCGRSADEIKSAFKARKESYLSDLCQPYPGIPELIREIAAAGMHNHICSNKAPENSKKYLDRDGLTPYFDVIGGVMPGIRRKPEPDMLKLVLRTRGIDGKQMLMVGDRLLDIEAGHNAGCDGCFFDPDRCNPRPDCAEYEAYTAEELRKIIFGD